MFRYLAAENAVLYRRVMTALVEEKQRFVVTLRPEEIRGGSDDVRQALVQLEQ